MASGTALSGEQLARNLWKAVDNSELKKVTRLLRQGADPNHELYWSEEWWPNPPLHMACSMGYLSIVKTLVEHKDVKTLTHRGADVNRGSGDNNSSPLHWACEGGHKDVVEYLVSEAKCAVDVRDNDGMTPLHWACEGGYKDVVQYLVEDLKYDVDVRDDEGQSPLDKALNHISDHDGCANVCLHLMSLGRGDDQQKAKLLCEACFLGKLDVVKELIEQHHVNPNDVTDDEGTTPLDLAREWHCTEVIDYLESRQQSAQQATRHNRLSGSTDGQPANKTQKATPRQKKPSSSTVTDEVQPVSKKRQTGGYEAATKKVKEGPKVTKQTRSRRKH